ncbi:unnamed protein product [Urochloa humidicola]
MSSPPFPGHAATLTFPTTGASACLLRPRAQHLLVRGLSRTAAATPGAVASPGLACSHHSSVAAAPSISPQCAGGGGCGLVALAVTASAVAVSVCLVFFSAIHSMLACKREAEFLEKYFDSVREKLPETMASLRLVGREVGDLASDLSELSQELTKGVKSSMSIVHTADAKLRQPTPSALPGTARWMANQKNVAEEPPLLASTVRDLREFIANMRAAAGIAGLLMWASNFGSARRKNRS